jgi:hypothetical protein
MKKQELRIGNLIEVNGVIQEVCVIPLPENCTPENTKPIPLTEEWLLRFGFVKGRKDKFWVILENQLMYKYGRVYYNSWAILESQPKYVHQLQNLYFALTNQELS